MPIDRSTAAAINFATGIYKLRTLGCALSFIFVATTTYPNTWLLWCLMAFNGVLWPHIAYRIALRSSSPYHTESRNLLLDCVFAGVWVAAMHFSLLPSLLLLSMVAMNSVTTKGFGFMLRGLLANALGAGLAGVFFGFELTQQTPRQVIFACIPMLMIYPFMVGWTTHQLAGQLLRQQRALSIMTGFDERMLTPFNQWVYRLAQVFLRCRCGSSPATVAHVRIEQFKTLRDRHGALVMDALSTRVGQLIKAEIRGADLVCMRQPGEFLVLLLQARAAGARALTDRIEDDFIHAIASVEGMPDARIRVGVVEFSYALTTESEWMALAEQGAAQAGVEQPGLAPLAAR
jgi:diguanylate cyclase